MQEGLGGSSNAASSSQDASAGFHTSSATVLTDGSNLTMALVGAMDADEPTSTARRTSEGEEVSIAEEHQEQQQLQPPHPLDDDTPSAKKTKAIARTMQRKRKTPPSTPLPSKATRALATGALGRWSVAEHEAFLQAVVRCGRAWQRVAAVIPTRTPAQVRSHAQKYFWKLDAAAAAAAAQQQQRHDDATVPAGHHHHDKENAAADDDDDDDCGAGGNGVGGRGRCHHHYHLVPRDLPASTRREARRILQSPGTVQREVVDTMKQLRARYRQLQRRLQTTLARQGRNPTASYVPRQRPHSPDAVVVVDHSVPPPPQNQPTHSHDELIALSVLRECLPNSPSSSSSAAAAATESSSGSDDNDDDGDSDHGD